LTVADRKVGWTAETILLGSGVFGNIAMSSLSPALPKIEQAFGGAEADYLTKMLVSATGLGVIMVSPFTGTLVRRFGRRAVLVGAYAVYLVFGLMGMVLPTLPLIIASRFVAGATGAVIVAMGLILIGDFYQDRPRERRIGASHAIGALVLALLVPVAGFLADVNWRLAFLIHLPALPMLLVATASRDLASADRVVQAAGKAGRRAGRLPAAVWLILLLALFAGGIGYSVQIFVPFHLRDIGAHSAGLAGIMLAVTLVTSVATSFLYAEVRRFVSAPAVFAIVMGGWALGLGITAVTTTVLGTLIGMGVTGLAGGLVGPNMFSAVSALTKDDAARAHSVGLVKGIYYFGPFFGPSMLQLLSLQTHAETALLSLSAVGASVALVCLAAAFVARRRGPLAAELLAATEGQVGAAYEAELESDRA
jgi:MFS family permease